MSHWGQENLWQSRNILTPLWHWNYCRKIWKLRENYLSLQPILRSTHNRALNLITQNHFELWNRNYVKKVSFRAKSLRVSNFLATFASGYEQETTRKVGRRWLWQPLRASLFMITQIKSSKKRKKGKRKSEYDTSRRNALFGNCRFDSHLGLCKVWQTRLSRTGPVSRPNPIRPCCFGSRAFLFLFIFVD